MNSYSNCLNLRADVTNLVGLCPEEMCMVYHAAVA
jgi:hypothetical protein